MRFAIKSALRNEHISPRRFTRLYIVALSSIALFAILGQILVQLALSQQSDDARVINLAGRQRFLSLKLTMAVSGLVIPSDPISRASRISEIKSTLNSFEVERHGLIYGDPKLGLPGNNSPAVTQFFNAMEPDFQAITDAVTKILNTIDADNKAPGSKLEPYVDIVLAHVEPFVTTMNTTVAQYQHEAEGRVTSLKVEELILFALTLIVLVLEGSFIFRPAIRKLHVSVTQLIQAEKQVAAHTSELENKNSELELAFQEALVAHRKVMPHARVVAYGHYQVQASNGSYYNVRSRDINGHLLLECECLMYRHKMICSHSLAAAALHSALLRSQSQRQSLNRPTPRPIMPDYRDENSGEMSS